MTTINVPHLRKALEYVTDHPEQWDQWQWGNRGPCGTTYCIAGTAIAQLTTHDLRWVDVGNGTFKLGAVRVDGIVYNVEYAARTVLGLDWQQATLLFQGSNTLYDLWCLAYSMTNGAIEMPPDLASPPSDEEIFA